MTIKLCLGTLAIVALHTLVWCTPAFAAEAPIVMPELRVTPACKTVVLTQGSGSVRVCKGGVL